LTLQPSKKFDNYCATGIRFVSRLKYNALVEILKEGEHITTQCEKDKKCMASAVKPAGPGLAHPLSCSDGLE
jgi:hypothetical protein